MSRKTRPPHRLELVREPAGETLEDERATVHRLTGELHDTFEAVMSGCALTADGERDAPPNGLGNVLGAVTFTTRILARALLARALDRRPAHIGPEIDPDASDIEDGVDDDVLDDIAQSLLPPESTTSIRSSRADRKAAFDDATFVVREVGLEEFDVSCDLSTSHDGTVELSTYALTPESAHVSLLEFLFHRAESAMFDLHPLLAAERDASSWEFSRWSVAPPPGRGATAMAAFARHVREQEYSLAERRTIALGVSLMGELATDEGFAELFPRQHRMAATLAGSFVDVFECIALHGSRATLRSLSNGRKYQVHEHMEPIEYSRGWIAAGRLYPFEGEVHLRSPGMIFFQPEDPEFLTAAVRTLASAHGTLAPGLALEQFISSVVFDVSVPRVMKPARSRADARDILAEIRGVIAEAEVERSIERDAELQLDSTLDGFMAALAEQAQAGHSRSR